MGGAMNKVRNEQFDPTPENIAMAWDIHKDADALLHNRLNAFLVVQALMFGAYFVAVDLNDAPAVRVCYQVVIFFAGAVVCFGYWRLSQRMIRGILRLKAEVLLPHVPVYERYYRAIEASQGVAPERYKDPHYGLHQWAPWIFFVLWCLLIAMAWATMTGWVGAHP